MTVHDVFGDRKKTDVIEGTWGHLKPEEGKVYEIELVYCYGEWGDYTAIRLTGIESSPWFYDAMYAYIDNVTNKLKPGNVYKFVGTYTWPCSFVGKTRVILI